MSVDHLSVPCPMCEAPRGEDCRSIGAGVHQLRTEEAEKLARALQLVKLGELAGRAADLAKDLSSHIRLSATASDLITTGQLLELARVAQNLAMRLTTVTMAAIKEGQQEEPDDEP